MSEFARAAGRPRLLTRRLRAPSRRTVLVPLSCRTTGPRCRGLIDLARGARTLARGGFSIRPGARGVARLRVLRRARGRLTRRGVLRLRLDGHAVQPVPLRVRLAGTGM